MSNDNPGDHLEALKAEHRALDERIRALSSEPTGDQLEIARLKSRKLMLKDQIQRIARFEHRRTSLPDVSRLSRTGTAARDTGRTGTSGVFWSVEQWQSRERWTNRTCLGPQVRITSRLINSLYTEAMLLADEARSYFDDAGREDRVNARAVRARRLRLRIAQGHDPDHAYRRLAADPARDRIRAKSPIAKAVAPSGGSAMRRKATRQSSTQLPDAAKRLINASRNSMRGSNGSTRAVSRPKCRKARHER